MDELHEQISRSAEEAVAMCESRNGGGLDYSEASLGIVDAMLEESAGWAESLTPGQINTLVRDFGRYVLEVGRREFGGSYQWYDERDQPVLVVNEPVCRVALLAWDKVRGRIGGDAGDKNAY